MSKLEIMQISKEIDFFREKLSFHIERIQEIRQQLKSDAISSMQHIETLSNEISQISAEISVISNEISNVNNRLDVLKATLGCE